MSITTAEQLEENEQYDKAYEEYKKVYQQRPKSIEVLEKLGHVAIILDKKDEAEEYYSKILELDATNVMAYEQLMDLYFHTDRYKYYIARGNLHVVQQEISHAVSDFKKALNKAEEVEEMNSTRFVLANLYEQSGKPHQAIDEYLRIIDSQVANELVYLKLAQVYFKEDSISSAIDILERARDNGYDTDAIKESLAQLYLKNNDPAKAREFTQDDLLKVRSLLDEDKNEQAFELLEMLQSENKKNPEYYSLLAQYYYNSKEWDKGLNAIEEFEKFAKNSPLAHQMRALIFEEQGKDYEAHINWAKFNIATKEKDVALNEYFSAFQLKNDDVVLVRNIAELLEETGEAHHANEFWERLVSLDSTNRKAIEKISDFRESIGDYRGQAEYLEMLYSLDNKNSLVIKKLANAYEKLKNKAKALEYYNKFLAVSPVNEDYERIQAKVASLANVEMEEDEGLVGKLMKLFVKK